MGHHGASCGVLSRRFRNGSSRRLFLHVYHRNARGLGRRCTASCARDGPRPAVNPQPLDGVPGREPGLVCERILLVAKRRMKKTTNKPSKLRKVVLQARSPPNAAYRRVCSIALALPGVEESTSYGTPSLKVKGKIMSRLRTEAEGALALRCDFLDRQILLQADPRAFFVTDHYLNYPMILIRLHRVPRSALPNLIERAWRMVAPPKLIAEHDASRARSEEREAKT